MNFGSDHRVRDAFRATLLDEKSSASVIGTQEVDAADVLEVTDLANAIARAEEALRARSSRALGGPDSSRRQESSDLFDSLVATDDAAGPALHAPYRPTPLPPRVSSIPLPPGVTRRATLLRAPEGLTPLPLPVEVAVERASAAPASEAGPSTSFVPPDATQPLAAVVVPPAPQTAPILILDEDAFYHPAGRIRTLAEVTLDGFRPEATVLVRARERRNTLSWVALLVLAPVLLIALFAVAVAVGRAGASPEPTTSLPATTTTPATATAAPTTPAKRAVTPAAAPVLASAPAATASPASTVPVFDVKSLKSVDVNSLKSVPPAKIKR